jgi:hypothetical protein
VNSEKKILGLMNNTYLILIRFGNTVQNFFIKPMAY